MSTDVMISIIGAIVVVVGFVSGLLIRFYAAKASAYEKELTDLKCEITGRIENLQGQITAYERMMARQCPDYQLDPQTGGCVRCSSGRFYGQQLQPGHPSRVTVGGEK